MTASVIFIGGVHGVGKTTFASSVASNLKIPFYSAGKLIQQYSESPTPGDKKVADVPKTQDILVRAIHTLGDIKSFVLDGHFCVFDGVGAISLIPKEIFLALKIGVVLILHDEPDSIHARLHSRDPTVHTAEQISQLQATEIAHGTDVASSMGIPLRLFRISEVSEAIAYIKSAP